jgi:hypothetical protein
MKQLLTFLFCLTIGQSAFATEWCWFYVYVQRDYIQGPWTRAAILDESGSNQYLHPKQVKELLSFSANGADLANAILKHLKKETPERYEFNCNVFISGDTVIIRTNNLIADFDAVKNELTASFTLNNFNSVKIIQFGKTDLFQLKDITVPYMDLVFPINAGSQTSREHDTPPKGPFVIKEPTSTTHPHPENKISNWLLISISINIALTILFLRQRRK